MAGGGRGHRGRDRGRIGVRAGPRRARLPAFRRRPISRAGRRPWRRTCGAPTRLRGGPRRRPCGGGAVYRPARRPAVRRGRPLLRPVRALDDGWRWDYASALIDIELGGTRDWPTGCAPSPAARRRSRRCGCGWARPSSRPGATTRPRTRGPARRSAGARRRSAASPRARAEAPIASYAALGLRPRGPHARRSRPARATCSNGWCAAPDLRSGVSPAGRQLSRARPRRRRRPSRLSRQSAARVLAVRRSDGGRPRPRVAKQHPVVAPGFRGDLIGQRGME